MCRAQIGQRFPLHTKRKNEVGRENEDRESREDEDPVGTSVIEIALATGEKRSWIVRDVLEVRELVCLSV